MKIKHLIEELLAAEESIEFSEGYAEGYQEGLIEGKMRAARNILVLIASSRYPDLRDMAQQRAERIQHLEVLCELINLLFAAPSEEMVRFILTTPPAA